MRNNYGLASVSLSIFKKSQGDFVRLQILQNPIDRN